MTEEYKTHDTHDSYDCHNARLTKDAVVIKTDKGNLVTLTFASTCRSDRYGTMWWEAKVNDYQSGLAQHLKKGDSLGISGKPGIRFWDSDDGEKRSALELIRAEIKVPPALFNVLKERGFKPGKPGEAPKKGATNKAKTTAKAKREIVEIPDDDFEDVPLDESDDDGAE